MRLIDLLELDELGLSVVAGSEGLDRQIRWVYTTDLIDPRPYLSGGELVLTSTLWRQTAADSDRFVQALVARNVAGLVGGHDAHGAMPEDLIDACRRSSLPLFNPPDGLSFGTISEAVIERVMMERDSTIARSLHRHRRLLTAIADGQGLPTILGSLAGDPPIDVWLLSEIGRVVASTGSRPPPDDELGRIWRGAVAARSLPAVVSTASDRRWSIFSVSSESGELLVCAGDREYWSAELESTVLEIAQFVAIERARVRDQRMMGRALGRALVRALASPATTVGELDALLDACGIDASAPMLAVTAIADGKGDQPAEIVHALLEDAFAMAGLTGAIGALGREIVAVISIAGQDASALETHLRASAHWCESALGSGRAAIGIGGAVTNLSDLQGALIEAGHARSLATIRSERIAIATSRELDSHALLLATTPESVRRAFYERLIGPLLQHDRSHRGELVHTLTVFLDEAGGWRRAAARLHVHVNTLRYRIVRMEELTGRNLSSMETRVDFYLALRAADEARERER